MVELYYTPSLIFIFPLAKYVGAAPEFKIALGKVSKGVSNYLDLLIQFGDTVL